MVSSPFSDTGLDDQGRLDPSSWSPPERHAPVRWGPIARGIEHLGDVADRLGMPVGTLLAGAAGTALVGVLAWFAFMAGDAPAPELTIPYASVAASSTSTTSDGVDGAGPRELLVHAAGAVRHPGVYLVLPGARVADVVSAAGGPVPEADLDRVNLAAPVADGSRVYLPRIGEDQPPGVISGGGPPLGGVGQAGVDPGALIDLNEATAAQFEQLPGIGPATAAAIVEHRRRHGRFVRVEDLLGVRGIGEAKLAALRDRVHV